MSVSNDNIKLSITTGEGISQAIDRQLDTEYNQDITLKRSEWNTIFEIVRNDQATQNKQYTGGNTDIGNSGHFIVKEGFYELTQNAWNQIKNIVNAKLGIGSGDVNTKGTESPVDENPTPETETDEQAVTRILSEAGIEVDANTLAQVVQKYPTMQAIETAGLTLEERVVNYAKGLKGQQATQNMALNSLDEKAEKLAPIQLTEVQEALNAGSQEDFNNAYIQYGQAQIETYDTNNNGKVELNEYLSVEQSSSGENYIESSAKAVFEFLDQNNNNTLDVEEMAALAWATSKINDTDNNKSAFDITQDEVAKVNNALTTIGLHAYMQEAKATASNEEMELLKQAILDGTPDRAHLEVMLQKGYKAFKAHLDK